MIMEQVHAPICHCVVPKAVEPHCERKIALNMEVHLGNHPCCCRITIASTWEIIVGHELSLGVRSRVVIDVTKPPR